MAAYVFVTCASDYYYYYYYLYAFQAFVCTVNLDLSDNF